MYGAGLQLFFFLLLADDVVEGDSEVLGVRGCHDYKLHTSINICGWIQIPTLIEASSRPTTVAFAVSWLRWGA